MADTQAQAAPAGETRPEAPRIKVKKPRQRACDEKDEKGKVCCGHLKRWYEYPAELEALVGSGAELYRCENCRVLYKPDLSEPARSFIHRY
jgi:hypothetical protein